MRRLWQSDPLRLGHERAVQPRARTFGSARSSVTQRLTGVLSPESLFRLALAFVLATALWLYVNSRNSGDLSFAFPQPIPVSAERVPPGLTIRNIIKSVHVNIRPAVASLAVTSDFVAFIDMHGYGPGIHKHVPVHLRWDASVSVVNWTPHTVTVVLERVVSKSVPVQIHVIGAPPYGYALKQGSLYATPPSITVSGPKPYVREVTRAVVDVALDTARSSVNASYSPNLENAQGNPLPKGGTLSPQRVRVHAVIQQLASYKTLPILATIDGEPATGFGITSIRVNPPGLTAYGSPHALSRLANLHTAPVHVIGLKAGTKTFRVKLRKPSGVYTPTRFKKVQVTVVVGPVTGASSISIAVTPMNLASGYGVKVSPDAVLVTVFGPSPQLASTRARVHAHIDLAGLGAGTYTLNPVVDAPKGFSIESVQPSAVTVTISAPGT